jgi:hypothetical protein
MAAFRRYLRAKSTALAFCLAAFPAAAACGSSPDEPKKSTDAGPADEPGPVFDGNLVSRDQGGCVSEVSQAEALPFDLYILFDQSGSMSTPEGAGNRLDAVRAALADFLGAGESAGMGVGIGYFGNFPLGEASCMPADYRSPAVPIELLPANEAAMLKSLGAVKPTGETPTGAALRGACDYAHTWKGEHPGKILDILLLTDGVPEAPISKANGCDPTLPDAVTATTACADEAGVRVFVLGVGPNLDNLNQIAKAGGTGSAFLVDGGDVTARVSAALGRIRGSAIPCSFELPPPPAGESFAFDRMNVVVTDTAGVDHALYNVDGSAACGEDGGWYYAPSDAPERVELCDASCTFAKAQSDGGHLRFALGCKTLTTTR